MTLKGKTVLITGGSKGIGKATAQAMASEGANIIINYTHDDNAAKETEEALKKTGAQVLVIKADISNSSQVKSMFAKIKKTYKNIDVAVLSAAYFDSNDVPGNLEALQKLFNINLLAQVDIMNEVRKLMPKGKIIFLSSIHGKLGHGRPNVIAYSAIKAALEQYMKNLAKALAPDILVNAIEPGRTHTPQWGDMTKEFMKEQAEGQLINRWIEPEEIADGAVFLAKNDAMCGEVLVIDGGMSLKVLG